MIAAFAYWEDRIAPVFDTARQIHVVEAEPGRILDERQVVLTENLMVQKALRLVELGIETLVCGAISRQVHELVVAYGIQVIPFVAGSLNEVVQAWIRGTLVQDAFAMPGCRGWGRRQFQGMNEMRQGEVVMRGNRRGMGPGSGPGKRQDGQRPGRMGGAMAAGTGGFCVCPQCGHKAPHERGIPCVQRNCPNCGAGMARQ